MFNKIYLNLLRFWPVLIPGILQVAFASYVAHNLSFEIWGRFVLIQLISNLIVLLLSQMINETAARFHYSDDNIYMLSDSATIYLIYLSLGLIFIVYPISNFTEVDYSLLSLMLIATTLHSYSGLIAQDLLLSGRANIFGISKVFESICKYVFPALSYIIYSTLDALVYSFLFAAIIYLLFSIYLSRISILFTFDIDRLIRYFNFSNQVIFLIPLAWVVSSSDRFFIKFLLDYSDVGIYAILASFAAIIGAVGQFYSFIVTPVALRLHSINEWESYKYIRSSLRVLVLIFIIIMLLSTLVPDSLYALFLGDSFYAFQENRLTFVFLLAGSVLATIQSALGLFCSLGKELHIISRAFFIGAGVNLVLNTLLIKYGILYAAFSMLLSYFFIVGYIVIVVNKRYIKIFTFRE